jgi:serine protease AprX
MRLVGLALLVMSLTVPASAAAQVETMLLEGSVAAARHDVRVSALRDVSSNAGFGVTGARLDAPGLDGDRDGDPASYSPADLVTAVIDSGIDSTHPTLDGGKVIGFADLVNGRTEPYDDLGHGTWVAGVVAGAGDPALEGVAPGSALVGVKVIDADGDSSLAKIADGIEWVIEHRQQYGIEAINLSIGDPTGCGDGQDPASQAVDAAVAAGLVVVAAVGNDGPGTCTVKAPAAAVHALSVGAMADAGAGGFRPLVFSSRGPTADGRIKPDVVAGGVDVLSAWPEPEGSVVGTGTSGSAPLVTGVALLMLDAAPGLAPLDVKARIMDTAVDWGPPGRDADYGAGRLDAYAAIHAAGAALATPPGMPGHAGFSGVLAPGASATHQVSVGRTDFPLAATLLGAGSELVLRDPEGDVVESSSSGGRQKELSAMPAAAGTYTLSVSSAAGGAYQLDVSAGLGPVDDAGPGLALDAPASPTSDATPAVAGSAGTAVGDFPGVVARIVRDGATVRTLRALPLPGGRWSVDATPALPDGTYEIRASQGDAAGNTTTTPPATLVVDTTPPPDPDPTDPDPGPSPSDSDDPPPVSNPPPASGPAGDSKAPRVSLAVKRGRRGLVLSVRCDEACGLRVSARLKRRVVGRASASMPAAGRKKIKLRVARRGRLTVRVVAADAAGNESRVARRVTLRRAPRS